MCKYSGKKQLYLTSLERQVGVNKDIKIRMIYLLLINALQEEVENNGLTLRVKEVPLFELQTIQYILIIPSGMMILLYIRLYTFFTSSFEIPMDSLLTISVLVFISPVLYPLKNYINSLSYDTNLI